MDTVTNTGTLYSTMGGFLETRRAGGVVPESLCPSAPSELGERNARGHSQRIIIVCFPLANRPVAVRNILKLITSA